MEEILDYLHRALQYRKKEATEFHAFGAYIGDAPYTN